MKKVINGHLCNTETAQLIGHWENGYLPNDFNYIEQTLYRTKAGIYFFQKYQLRWTGDTGRLTEFLDITTCQEAKEWVAEKLSGEDYEKILGTPDEGKLISVSAETLAIIDKYREERNLTYDQAIKKLITK